MTRDQEWAAMLAWVASDDPEPIAEPDDEPPLADWTR